MRRWRRWVLLALLVWICFVAWWSTRPVTDTVPTGVVNGVETSQSVQCDSPLSGHTTSPDPIPELPDPPGPWVRAYERTPCELPIHNNRMILWVDIGFVVVGGVVLAKTWKPGAASKSSDDMALA
jgi:hypothetical protein